MYDVIVIGSGPAGVTTAIYTRRSNLKTLIVSKDGGALEKAKRIDNYYGFSHISGKELYNLGLNQAKQIGVDYLNEEVIAIENDLELFKVITKNNEYKSRAVVLATGVVRNTVNIEGMKEFEGRGVSYCAICDSFFFKDKDVAVLGNGEFATHEVLELLPVVNSVTILTNGKEKINYRDERVKVFDKRIKRVEGNDKLENIEFEDNTKLNISAIFVAEGTATSFDFAKRIGANMLDNNILVDEEYMTNIPGLFAAGDCIGGLLQVSKAVSDGACAGVSVVNYIRKNK